MLDLGESGESEELTDAFSISADPVTAHLQSALTDYLKSNPRLTLNAISKKCAVSEPTLRRIVKGQIKTRVSLDTIVDVISYIAKETNISKLVKKFQGPLADHLSVNLGHLIEDDHDIKYSAQLNASLADPIKFLIYNLTSGYKGTTQEKVRDLFGLMGLKKLDELLLEELVKLEDGRYISDQKSFSLQHKHFVSHFKATSEFIKTEKLDRTRDTNLFANLQESVSFEAYREILKIQRTASRRILQILDSPESQGPIPMFALVAVDTLSTQTAPEIKESDDHTPFVKPSP